jgi:hypothetical protein
MLNLGTTRLGATTVTGHHYCNNMKEEEEVT